MTAPDPRPGPPSDPRAGTRDPAPHDSSHGTGRGRRDPDAVAQARRRVELACTRARRLRQQAPAPVLAAIMPTRQPDPACPRLIGRAARRLPTPAPDTDWMAPELALAVDPALAARVFAAAAAALMARRLAAAITPPAIEALGLSPEARAFGLAHRALALPRDACPDLPTLTARLQALWAARLPPPLDVEFGGRPVAPLAVPAAHAAVPAPEAPSRPSRLARRRWWPGRARPGRRLPLSSPAAGPDPADRHHAALDAALAALVPGGAR